MYTEAADVIIHVFTNQSFAITENNAYLRERLTNYSRRPCVLIYRASAEVKREELLHHTQEVAQVLYGEGWREHVLGRYRALDDNAAAEGGPVELTELDDGPPLLDLLAGIDPRRLRGGRYQTLLKDVLDRAERWLEQARQACDELEVYETTLKMALARSALDALRKFNKSPIHTRLRELFETTAPLVAKGPREFGRAMAYVPMKLGEGALWAYRGAKGCLVGPDPPGGPGYPADTARGLDEVEEVALALRNNCLNLCVSAVVTRDNPDVKALLDLMGRIGDRPGSQRPRSEPVAGSTGEVRVLAALPPALREAQRRLSEAVWRGYSEGSGLAGAIRKDLEGVVDRLVHGGVSPLYDDELLKVARKARAMMTTGQSTREVAVALLGLVPAVVAIAYVVYTGDAVNAGHIAGAAGNAATGATVKTAVVHGAVAKAGAAAAHGATQAGILTPIQGVLGYNDLYAFIALPFNVGTDALDRAHLAQMLSPTLARWTQEQHQAIEDSYRRGIAGALIDEASRRRVQSRELIRQAEIAVKGGQVK
jgi:hypothetical protein